MPRPVAPTESLRLVLQGFSAVMLGPSQRPGYRRVQIFTPSAPQIALAIDRPDPASMGPSRTYALTPVSPGQVIPFVLLPDQVIYGATADGTGMAIVGVIVEHLEEV